MTLGQTHMKWLHKPHMDRLNAACLTTDRYKSRCNIYGTQTESEADSLPVNLNESMDSISSLKSTESEWIPEEEMDITENDENNNPHHITVLPQNHQSRIFVVFEECLDQLLNQCVACGQKCVTNNTVVRSMLSVSTICACGESFTWESQPLIGSMPVGKLVQSASILISGNCIVQSLMMFNHANIACFSERKFHNFNNVTWCQPWSIVFKKLEASGKKCKKVAYWARSVSNHLYWCAASSNENGELVMEKWFSVLNHVANIYEGHGKPCLSCLLEDRDWIKQVVKGRPLVKDIKQISPAEQISALEAYQKIVCHFASKSLHFFYAPMKARLYIAALHFNENSCRDQAKTRNGEPVFSVSYPEGRHGSGVPKEVKVKQSYRE
ncbi:uncharacterized protein LOC125677033 [Ostrea edulis]|uniref:uncharacterized protein LOC125677033 n=1 Tax=Ostrea edulis TaxID=37623 RepID=UPI0024AFAC46|nr:uncharacterized protein LOC125677033 [Ostrea edulis]